MDTGTTVTTAKGRLLAYGAAVLWAFIALHALLRYFSAAFVYPLWSSLLAVFIGLSAYAGGNAALKWLGMDFKNSAPLEIAASLTGGLAIMAAAIMTAGFCGVFWPATAALICGAMLWLGRRTLRPGGTISMRGLNPYLLVPCAALLAVSFVAAWAPAQQYDSLVYHLPLVKHYMDTGRIAAVPFNLYSHFPQTGEMLFSYGLLFNSEVAAQLTSWLCLLASALWIYGYSSATSRNRGLLAVLLTLSHSSLLVISSTTYVEPSITLWVTGAVISFLLWKEAADTKQAWLWMLLSGICAGSAFGTKYYAAITCILLFGMSVSYCFTIGWFSQRKARLAQALLFGALCAALFLPWAVKNTVEVGNPVFPFFYRLFSSADITRAEAHGYFNMITEYNHRADFFKELVTFPYLSLTQPSRYGGGMDVLGILGWELLFAAVPLMIYAARKKTWARWLGLYLALHMAAWFLTGTVLRFLIVLVPLASLLAAEGFLELYHTYPTAKIPLAAGLGFFLLTRLLLYGYMESVSGTPQVLLGMESRTAFLARTVPYYECALATNIITPPQGTSVLLAGEARYYYFKRPVMPTNLYRGNDFVTSANRARDYQELAADLKGQGITHIVYAPKEFSRLKQYLTLSLTLSGQKNWEALLSNTEKLYQGRTCALYELK